MEETAWKLISFDFGNNADESGVVGRRYRQLPYLGLKFGWKALEVDKFFESLHYREFVV
jgi:hypothetical protein